MEQWKAQMQEKHLAMLGKTSLLAGLFFMYEPFSELLEQTTSSYVVTGIHIMVFAFFIYWTQKFLFVAAHNTKSSSEYTDEYVRQLFKRSCYWAFNAVMAYLAMIWFSSWWVFWLGQPSISEIGQFGFAFGLFIQGVTTTYWLYRDNMEQE